VSKRPVIGAARVTHLLSATEALGERGHRSRAQIEATGCSTIWTAFGDYLNTDGRPREPRKVSESWESMHGDERKGQCNYDYIFI
jgi:hypothetical protein